MHSAPSETPRPLPPVQAPVGLVFCDFDETFWCHSRTGDARRDLSDLIDALETAAVRDGIVFGWVTGNNLRRVDDHLRAERIRFRPHFAGTDLGTRLVTFAGAEAHEPSEWRARMHRSGFSAAAVDRTVDRLVQEGLPLRPQPSDGVGSHLRNFYLRSRGTEDDTRAVGRIKHLAGAAGVDVHVNRCNPEAGDPADCFDVDFVPRGCGKAAVVAFMQSYYGVPAQRCAAFGDSGNDLDMLSAVGHGWLVGNATSEARSRHHQVTRHSYAAGVLEGIQEFMRELQEVSIT